VKELIEYIATALVDQPEQVEVRQEHSSGKLHVELKVGKDDMGRVIGKGGRVANAMRILLRVAAASEGKQSSLDVIDPL
jgi:predicted RNA-binding protein YlqC (UPF0109 family)